MLTGKDVLIVFYAVYLGTLLSLMGRYRLFAANLLFSLDKIRKKQGWFRLCLGFSMNIAQILLFLFLYQYIILATSGICSILSAAIASLSVFGLHRILHAFIATDNRWERFYSTEEYQRLLEEWGVGNDPNTFRAYLISGLCCVIIPIVLSYMIRGRV